MAVPGLLTRCVCGKTSDVQHSMSCKKGGLVTVLQNELRDNTAKMLEEVCKDIVTEPMLVKLTETKLRKKAIIMTESTKEINQVDQGSFFLVSFQRQFYSRLGKFLVTKKK